MYLISNMASFWVSMLVFRGVDKRSTIFNYNIPYRYPNTWGLDMTKGPPNLSFGMAGCLPLKWPKIWRQISEAEKRSQINFVAAMPLHPDSSLSFHITGQHWLKLSTLLVGKASLKEHEMPTFKGVMFVDDDGGDDDDLQLNRHYHYILTFRSSLWIQVYVNVDCDEWFLHANLPPWGIRGLIRLVFINIGMCIKICWHWSISKGDVI